MPKNPDRDRIGPMSISNLITLVLEPHVPCLAFSVISFKSEPWIHKCQDTQILWNCLGFRLSRRHSETKQYLP